MILVLLGTQDRPFTRLLDAVVAAIDVGLITEEVVVQSGHTPYEYRDSSGKPFPPNLKMSAFFPLATYADLVARADVIVTHGGVGSILDGVKRGVPVIAAARLEKYGEHQNNHQTQIIGKLADAGYLIALDESVTLADALETAKTFRPKAYVSNTERFIARLEAFINE
jgi:UDP-N-acetylglucosamine transferase subunit ALG13